MTISRFTAFQIVESSKEMGEDSIYTSFRAVQRKLESLGFSTILMYQGPNVPIVAPCPTKTEHRGD